MEEKASTGELVRDFIQRNVLIVGLILVGVVLAGVGGVQYLASNNSPSDLEFTAGAESQQSQVAGVTSAPTQITVDVAGEVKRPGIYTVESGARVADALEAAGGISATADTDYIQKRINLAQKVIDGGKIYIPAVGETPPAVPISASNSTTGTTATDTSTGLIDINNASEKELDTLPKVGPVTAQKIIAGRPYATIEELVSKKVMTQKTFDGLKDRIVAQ